MTPSLSSTRSGRNARSFVAAAEATPVGLLMAAMRPERVDSLVVVNAYARVLWDVDYPEGLPAAVAEQGLAARYAVVE